MWPTPPTPDKHTIELARQISRIKQTSDIEVFGPEIVGIMEAAGGDRFRDLDERPGTFNDLDGRFWMLRTVRNDPVWGPRLFRALSLKRRRRRKPAG